MGILSGLALGAANAGVNLLGNKIQQDYYKKNQERAFAMAQNEEKLRASNQKQGLIMAGLNPAAAADKPMAAGSAPNSPLGSMAPVDFAQASLAMAEAEKAQAEAQNTQVDVNRKNVEDATNSENLNFYFTHLAEDRLKELGGDMEAAKKDTDYMYYSSMAENAKDANKGAMDGLRAYYQVVGENSDLGLKLITNELESLIKKGQLDDKQVFKALVRDPDASYRLKLRQAALAVQQAFFYKTQGKSIYHSDLNQMVDNNDMRAAAIYAGEKIFDNLAELGPVMLMRRLFPKYGRAPTTKRAMSQLEKLPTPMDFNSSALHFIK